MFLNLMVKVKPAPNQVNLTICDMICKLILPLGVSSLRGSATCLLNFTWENIINYLFLYSFISDISIM